MYNSAKSYNSARAYTYLRLAQIYIKYKNDPQQAQEVLQEGLQNSQNNQDRERLESALSQLENYQPLR
jgi:outer membrane PBP1 activator LpoA protein